MSDLFDPYFFWVHVGFFFTIGAFFGSFFNVCIYRLPAGQRLSFPRSYCHSCGTTIPWYDNIPVASYLVLRGRCRVCRSRYSARYALIELLTAFLFLGVFLQYRFLWAMPTYLVFTALLLICTFTDIDHWAILDRVSLGGAAAGVLFALLIPHLPRPIVTAAHSAISGAGEVSPAWAQWSKWIVAYAGPAPAGEWWGPAANSLVGALAGASFLWVIGLVGSLAFRKPAMGFGDVKLLLLIGAFTGWKIALLSIFLASVFGSVYGLTVLALDRIEGRRARARAGPGDGAEMLAEIEAVLDDGSESARRRGWAFSAREKAALTRILSAPKSVGEGVRHHLPFGPHLALAAWLLMAFAPQVTREIERFFSLRY